MGISIALTASQSGATICNRVEVMNLLKDSNGDVCGARVRDNMSGEEWDVKAKCVVNATGPFCGTIKHIKYVHVIFVTFHICIYS